MADPVVRIRRSSVSGKIPTTGQLRLGELALNTTDGKLFTERESGGVGVGTTVIALNPWNVGLGSDTYDIHFIAGSVGIGTDDPTENLDINGDIRIRGGLYDSFNNIGGNGELLTSTGAGVSWTNTATTPAGQSIVEQQASTPYYITASDVTLGVSTAGFIDTTIVAKDGRIGIGTDNPTTLLDIRSTNALMDTFLTLGGDRNNANSEVGILFKDRNVVAGLQTAARINSLREGSQGNFSLVFSTSVSSADATEKLRITSAGNVGINSTAPIATLDVNGTLNVSGVSTFQDNVNLGDNDRLIFGDGQDLRIFHDGTDDFIFSNSSSLKIAGSRVVINNAANTENQAVFTQNGAVELYYDNFKKFETTGFGVTVFGRLDVDELDIGTGVAVTTILDEDNMVSDSDTALATQQSIKAYVDNQFASQDLDFAGDTGIGAVNLSSETFTIEGTANEIETVGLGNTLTIGLPNNISITDSLTVGSATTISSSGIIAGIITGTLDNTLTLATSGNGLSGSTTYDNSGPSTFTVTSNATSVNTPDTIVYRDSSGNFSAGTITADLTGTATTANNLSDAANITTGTINDDRLPDLITSNININSGISSINTLDVTNATIDNLTLTAGIAVTSVDTDLTTVSTTDDTLASAKAIKEYVDNQLSGANLDFAGDTGSGTINLDSETFDISGTLNEIETVGSGNTITIGLPNDVTIGQDLTVTRDVNILRNLDVIGNITVGGTSATIFTQTLQVEDPDIVLGIRTDGSGNDVSTDNTANHGGIAIASTEGNPLVNLNVVGIETLPPTYKKIMWFKSGTFTGLATDAWLTNYAFGIGTTSMSNGTRLAVGNIEFNDDDITNVRNINATGIITASSFSGNGASVTNVDAVTLDGLDSTQFLRSDVADTKTGITTFSDAADFNGNVDIDGHTELDDLNVSGVSTFANTIDANGNLDVDGHTELDDLNVSGVSTFVGDVSIADKIVHTGDTNTAIRFLANDTFTVETSGSERLRITSGGDVGIGTDAPSELLDVNGNARFRGAIYDNNNVVGAANSIIISTGSGFVWADSTSIPVGDANTLDGLDSTQFLRSDVADTKTGVTTFSDAADFNGNVDIDGHTELDDLNVSGVSTFSGAIDANGILDVDGHTELDDLNVSGVSTFVGAADFNGNVDIDGHTELDDLNVSGVSTFANTIDANGNLDVDGHTELDDLNVSGVSTFVGAADFNGNVDIDGHTELDDLNVSGVSTFVSDVSIADKIIHTGDADTAIRFPANDTFTVETAGSERFRVTSTGDVGIGTTNPQTKLDIFGDVSIASTVSIGTTIDIVPYNNLGTLSFEGSAGQLFSITNNLTSGSIYSVNDVSGIPSIDVDADGTIQLAPFGASEYVGIGKTDPQAKLDVNGDALVSGNLGIGTTNPTQKLDVNGDARFRGAIYDNNNVVGAANSILTSTGSGVVWADSSSIPVGDANTLDGLDSTQFLRSDADDTKTGITTFSDAADFNGNIDVDGHTELDDLNVSGVSTFANTIDANGNLDVDGHTELDDLNVSGVSTFAGAIDANGDLDVDGHTELDDLNVSGVSTFVSDVSIADKITHQGDTDTAIRFPANDTFTVETAGSERLRVTSSGDVGIGTDAPSELLDVNGDARFRGAIYDNNNVVGAANSILTSTGSGVVWADSSSIPVGDAATLDGLDSTQFLRSDADDTKTGITTFTGDAYFGGQIYITDTFGGYEQIEIASNDVRVQGKHLHSEFGVWCRSSSVSDRNTGMEATSNELRLYSNSTEQVRIDSTGQVGIGTDNPTEKLDVRGNIAVNETTVTGSATASLSTLLQNSIHTLPIATYRSVEYTIQATQGTNFHATKILALHNGTTAYHSEYGTIFNNSSVAAFDVDISGGNIRLLATSAVALQTDYVINFVATKL